MKKEERQTSVALSIGILIGLAINVLAAYGLVSLFTG